MHTQIIVNRSLVCVYSLFFF